MTPKEQQFLQTHPSLGTNLMQQNHIENSKRFITKDKMEPDRAVARTYIQGGPSGSQVGGQVNCKNISMYIV